jgi:hypothetical protein
MDLNRLRVQSHRARSVNGDQPKNPNLTCRAAHAHVSSQCRMRENVIPNGNSWLRSNLGLGKVYQGAKVVIPPKA